MASQLTDGDLPELFKAADETSLNGQRMYLRGTKLRLSFAVLSAVLAVFSYKLGDKWDVAALGVALAFIITLLVEVWMLLSKPERDWYDGRAFAESIKSLAWRYAVAAEPFPHQGAPSDEERHFVTEIRKLINEAPSDSIVITSPVHITESMKGLRRAPLIERRDIYLKGRIEDQLKWYSGKARHNVRLARRWRVALIVIEGLGITLALLKAGQSISIDAPGIVAAVLGAGSAWFAVRQYESLGRAYTFAANDLSTVYSRLEHITEESEWARESADAEEAISREHTMWRASRGAS
ncbi:DUF4231 domain-containing protein [Streptomyces sp. NPDC059862]|uniref:DUF4231 domain-containing protein n=1 Tax=Streptomyces sp. NPDC059862 TaxID=3346975 RepID=UPI003663E372